MSEENKVYEIVDSSNDEMYYPLTICRSLTEAKYWIKGFSETESVTEYGCDGEHEEITVRQREFGKDGEGKEVFKVNREAYFKSEDDDCMYWRTVEPESK